MVKDDERLNKKEELDIIEAEEFEVEVLDIAYAMTELDKRHRKAGFFEITATWSPNPPGLLIHGIREESDLEFKERKQTRQDAIDRQSAALNKTEREELSELERLLAKHGDKLKKLLG